MAGPLILRLRSQLLRPGGESWTRLVVEYIEKFWCPTVESGQFLED